jgi:hypothetical protein
VSHIANKEPPADALMRKRSFMVQSLVKLPPEADTPPRFRPASIDPTFSTIKEWMSMKLNRCRLADADVPSCQ